MSYHICADIGGTKINTGIVKNNKIVKNHKVKTEARKGLKSVLHNLKKSIDVYLSKEVQKIGISFAGPVDFKKGVIIRGTHFPESFNNLNLKKIIQNWHKKPVFIEHDGFCFTLAESILGAGKNHRYVIGLTLGTGVGGGFVINKKIYRGFGNLMEVGHMKITETGFKCSCQKFGHFESQVAGPALIKFYKKYSGKAKKPREIEKLAKKGDKAALCASREIARYLGISLANYVNTLSPDIFIIGGGLSRFKMIFPWAKKELSRQIIYPRLNQTKIVKSKLEDNALLLGASLITYPKYQN